jgi:hypothetical protein
MVSGQRSRSVPSKTHTRIQGPGSPSPRSLRRIDSPSSSSARSAPSSPLAARLPDSLPDAGRIPAPPSATAESLWANLPTWHPGRRCFGKNSPDEAPAAAVFFLSAASSDAHGWSLGTCRRHHRREGFTVDPTSSTPRSVPLLPHPTRLRLQFQFFSRPGHPLAIRFQAGLGGSSATGMMGENGLVTRSRRFI